MDPAGMEEGEEPIGEDEEEDDMMEQADYAEPEEYHESPDVAEAAATEMDDAEDMEACPAQAVEVSDADELQLQLDDDGNWVVMVMKFGEANPDENQQPVVPDVPSHYKARAAWQQVDQFGLAQFPPSGRGFVSFHSPSNQWQGGYSRYSLGKVPTHSATFSGKGKSKARTEVWCILEVLRWVWQRRA